MASPKAAHALLALLPWFPLLQRPGDLLSFHCSASAWTDGISGDLACDAAPEYSFEVSAVACSEEMLAGLGVWQRVVVILSWFLEAVPKSWKNRGLGNHVD